MQREQDRPLLCCVPVRGSPYWQAAGEQREDERHAERHKRGDGNSTQLPRGRKWQRWDCFFVRRRRSAAVLAAVRLRRLLAGLLSKRPVGCEEG